jgi:hypothetical protein
VEDSEGNENGRKGRRKKYQKEIKHKNIKQ